MTKYLSLFVFILVCASCSSSTKLVATGPEAPIQEGLKIELQANSSSAQIRIGNTTQEIVTIFKWPRFITVIVAEDSTIIAPDHSIDYKERTALIPDDFVLIGPGQTI